MKKNILATGDDVGFAKIFKKNKNNKKVTVKKNSNISLNQTMNLMRLRRILN